MTREFIHFGTFGQEPSKPVVDVTVTGTTDKDFNEASDKVAEAIQKMIENGQETGELCIEMPDDLSPEEAEEFIHAVMQNLFNNFNDDEDDE